MEAVKREVIGVCGGQGTEEDRREVVFLGCRLVDEDKKSKDSRGRPRRKEEKLGVEGCLEG
jgi:hypothetical protein